jgi:triosephosphate isomerase (TIM)
VRKIILAANWKMNLTHSEAESYVDIFLTEIGEVNNVDLQERDDNRVEEVLELQIRKGLRDLSAKDFPELVIAYEPVWAIGTGRTATAEQAQKAHAFIRSVVASISDHTTAEKVRIQYGGSLRPENAQELMRQKDVDGALVGGASLNPGDFSQIIRTAAAALVQ